MVDYIPPQYGYPLAAILWLILFVMIIRDRRKLNKALKQRPSLKILNRQTREWVDYNAPPAQEIFDQDEYAQQPVNHRFEPGIRAASEIPNPPKGSSA